MNAFIRKLRVFENGAQDNAGSWICHQFPEIHWIRSNYQTYCYAGPSWDGSKNNKGAMDNLGPHTWKPYAYNGLGQHQWALEHIIGNHGELGRQYPIRQLRRSLVYLEGGGTIPFLALINKGLASIDHPHWGGWSGRYSKEKKENVWSKHASVATEETKHVPFTVHSEVEDQWTDSSTGNKYENIYAPVWRWRSAFFNDFQCRMDWCIKPFEEANHHPTAVINGNSSNQILMIKSRVGSILSFDAGQSFDVDKDSISFKWTHYKEAGTYPKLLKLEDTSLLSFQVPSDAAGKEIHLILEVQDRSTIASLSDYRRVVINVD